MIIPYKQRLLSTKLQISLLIFVTSVVLLFFNLINETTWRDIVFFVVTAYLGSSTAEKWSPADKAMAAKVTPKPVDSEDK